MCKNNLLEKLSLSKEQEKAFNRLERAFKDCKKHGIWFEQSHETLIALNGVNVVSVEEYGGNLLDNEIDIQDCGQSSVNIGVCPWIDVFVAVSVKE